MAAIVEVEVKQSKAATLLETLILWNSTDEIIIVNSNSTDEIHEIFSFWKSKFLH